jgi:hypothetical protein
VRSALHLRNRRGEPIDPVPFGVSVGLGFMLAFSIGPIYGQAYGISIGASLAWSAGAFLVVTLVAYAQLVYRAPALDAGPLPPGPRFERLLYAAMGFGAVLVGITLPLI